VDRRGDYRGSASFGERLMQLQLRPAAPRFHPLIRPMYRRAGFAGLGLTPGYTPAQQALADQFASQFGAAPPAVYQAPTYVTPPSCVDSQGNALGDPACVNQLLQVQAQNMAAANAANYAVLRANCENAWAENDARYKADGIVGPPNDCAQRTFGLTLPGTTGGTNVLTPNAQAILDPTYRGPGSGSGAGAGAGSGAGTGSGGGGATPVLSFTNLTSGDNSNFKVGDRWQIQITGAPANHPVSVTGGQNGANTTTPMGTSDGSGHFTLNGQIDQSQIGNWSESWTVGPVTVGSFSFTVSPAGSSGQSTKSTQTTTSTSTLPGGSITIGGTSVPLLAIGAGVVVLFLLMRK
jgi:hypothetical protein